MLSATATKVGIWTAAVGIYFYFLLLICREWHKISVFKIFYVACRLGHRMGYIWKRNISCFGVT